MKTALIVEDTPDNLVLIQDILELNGFRVVHAEDGQQGIEKARQAGLDLILLDIQLPDIDGFQVLKAIRHDPCCDQLPIIAMTSYAMAGDRKRLLNAGCDGYIEKPIDPSVVMRQIEACMQAKRKP